MRQHHDDSLTPSCRSVESAGVDQVVYLHAVGRAREAPVEDNNVGGVQAAARCKTALASCRGLFCAGSRSYAAHAQERRAPGAQTPDRVHKVPLLQGSALRNRCDRQLVNFLEQQQYLIE